ncbi:protein of unknown function (plasmid) [Rhodovastum atsumiense]|nr:protein of unknown function [Rhodovastum atsumiense]
MAVEAHTFRGCAFTRQSKATKEQLAAISQFSIRNHEGAGRKYYRPTQRALRHADFTIKAKRLITFRRAWENFKVLGARSKQACCTG